MSEQISSQALLLITYFLLSNPHTHLPCIVSSHPYSAASQVVLNDDSFAESDFAVVSGQLKVQWDRISPASNVTHAVILQPLKNGFYNVTHATVTYVPSEGSEARVRLGAVKIPIQVLVPYL